MSKNIGKYVGLPLVALAILVFLPLPGVGSPTKRVILIETMPVPVVLAHVKGIISNLERMGYMPGKNLDLTVIKAQGDRQRAEKELETALKAGRPDLVITVATMATQTAVSLLRGTDVPVLFCVVSDPVGAGVIERIGVATGTNVTGVVYGVPREIKVRLVMRLVGQTTASRPMTFGFIHSTYPSARGDLRELQAIEKRRGDIRFLPYAVEYRKVPQGMADMLVDVAKGVEALKGRVRFWWEPAGPLGEVDDYTRVLLDNPAIPVAFGTTMQSVKMGALMQVNPNWPAASREVALLASDILNDKKPGEIPVKPPSVFELGINLSTALKLGIVVPPDLLEMAGDNVYR